MDKILRQGEVEEIVGLSRTTIWRMVRAGRFPAKVRLSLRARGWLLSDIEAWLTSRQRVGSHGAALVALRPTSEARTASPRLRTPGGVRTVELNQKRERPVG
jgi:prophage regulatory protein